MRKQSRSNIIAEFKRSHPICKSFHTGKFGFERIQDCVDLSRCIYDTPRAAEIARSHAAQAYAEKPMGE